METFIYLVILFLIVMLPLFAYKRVKWEHQRRVRKGMATRARNRAERQSRPLATKPARVYANQEEEWYATH